MKAKLTKIFSIVFPLALGAFLTIYSYNQFTEDQILEIKSYFKNANYFFVALALFLAFLGNAARAYRWKYALEHMGYESSFANNFMAVNVGYLLNLTVPKSGEISRAVIVKKYNNIPFDKGFGSIVAERIVDMFFLLGFVILAFVLQFNIVKTFILDKMPITKIIILLSIGLAFGLVLLGLYCYSKHRWILFIKEKIAGLIEGVLSIFRMKKRGKYLLFTLFIWGSYIVTFYISTFVFAETSHLGFGAIISAFVVGSIAIAFTNSGFGSYPFLISKILAFYTIAETTGNAYGWIIWTSQMFLVLVLGLVSFVLLSVRNKH
ncbi:lysylphosphatidylglycerol synthase transmembrane domain-containing protein [Flavobacterium branchiophilum]|uniref:TIGR00374 family protein n=2 Tax=Flavobacterium branchiophilum TaxID=55197 RepID=G2Z4F9_FLABF|nr:lysylphosphatidylglycerol synthase transmembrane domain-containing protein [Flavobacterium branchiophilum]PDS24488.1 lysylphosphatidylglycerol synthetase family protein [Flavobacterium branchiophilum]CCB68434.1 Probable transmembrane protein of unknown function [Flavobacterium branchiophilum FL-15]